MSDNASPFIYLKDYAPSAYVIDSVDLDVTIAPGTCRVAARLAMAPRKGTAPGTPLVLDGEELTLVSVSIDGKALTKDAYEASENGLTIHTPPAAAFVLETEVDIEPEENTELSGLYRSEGIWCTQCEAEGFRRITYFLDRPDVMATYSVRITADKAEAPVLLSNGNPRETGELPDGRHFAVWDDPHPKPAYLFALVAGDLDKISDSFTTASGRTVDLNIYTEHGKAARADYAMDSLKRSMKWDEERFGREYDLDVFNIVAVSSFNAGAMENKGLNIFNDRFILADPESATDADYADIERVVAHEYFHNWTGNRITCRDWFQLCLKEGLTVYRDQAFSADMRSKAVNRIEDVRLLRQAQFAEDGGPLAHPVRPEKFREINNFYTATVYNKGAEVVRMIASLLGEDGFRAGMDLYFERHDGEATTVEAFLKSFEDANKVSLGDAFYRWYAQAGTPRVTVTDHWDEANRRYTLTLAQRTEPTPGQETKQPLKMPMRFGLVGPNGADMEWERARGAVIRGDVAEIEDETTTLTFEGLSARPVPSLFRGFSAPVTLDAPMNADQRLFLAGHDRDPFNRWQAMQDVASAILVPAARGDGPVDADAVKALAGAIEQTLRDASLDAAFKASCLALPTESSLARTLARNVDPERVHQVRRDVLAMLGEQLRGVLGDLADAAPAADAYDPGAQQAGPRGLRNQASSLLAATGEPADQDRTERHYRDAGNMTDRMAALGALVASNAPAAESCMADFHERFCADPLVLDKWLRLTGATPSAAALDRVKAVYDSAEFDRGNPNRLRSLIGGFAAGNQAQFARADGQGFAFVADVIAWLDGRNPQLASRLLTVFSDYGIYESSRRAAARQTLESLTQKGGLSRDTNDILVRMLGKE
ncbi:aminopeptidase N [Cucumibacter marinus]|uniref:aminopeptidase N n=1 Tax=Cucumibacter marinus TaxID=1121252 RepID=UPI0003F64F44|nr:aminopeptidase N [Cucumibacter marinus]